MLFCYCFGLFNPNPQQMRIWSLVLFLLVFLKLTREVGKGWLLPDQTSGLPEDAEQLCPPSVPVTTQAPWGMAWWVCRSGLQEAPFGS